MDINEAWKSTCRVLLKEEIGELEDFGYYLRKYVGPVQSIRKSYLSAKTVTTADDDSGKAVRYISNAERAQYSKLCSAPFDINSLKDIDLLVAALKERFIYSGDIVLGNSYDVQRVQRCSDVSCVHDSQDISDSKYVAHCAMLRRSSYVFGSDCTGEIDFVIKNFQGWRSRRMLETANTQYVADAYFCANIRNCQEVMFSFNQDAKSHMIGNVALARDEYAKLKAKLVAEIADALDRKKDIVSIAELLGGPSRAGAPEERPANWNAATPRFLRPKGYPLQLDAAFAETAKILFGRALAGRMTDYEVWLLRHVRAPPKAYSAASGKPLWILPILFNEPVRPTHLSEKEAKEAGKNALTAEGVHSLVLENAIETLAPIAFFTCDVALGNSIGLCDVVSHSDSNTVFASSTMYGSKRCAYDCWVSHDADNMFGCDHAFYSKFCINAYRSLRLMRCFEVSDSLHCSDCYFCHNCEDLVDCMFCFNAKGLRHAIGNVELPREIYREKKGHILAELATRIENGQGLGLDIYNIGAN